MDYKKYLMEDALESIIDYRGKTPKKSDHGILTLSAKAVRDGYIDYSKCYCISDEEYERFMVRGLPQVGDVLLTTEAPLGITARLDRSDIALAQRLLTLRGKEGVLDTGYLYYYLRSHVGQGKLRERQTGTTVTGIKQAEFRKIEIELPDIGYQKKVASYLEVLDDKIAINKKINTVLSEQIRILCDAWLNDYIPFGGECPDDWTLTPLSSFAKFVSGYAYKGNELQPSSVAMATIKNFERKGGFKLDGYKEIIPSSKLKPGHHAALFDTLVAHTDLTQNADVIGNAEPVLSFSGYNDIIFSMDVVKVLPNNPAVSRFLIAAILQTKQFKRHCLGYVNGTTVLHLSKKALPEYSLMMPENFDVLKPLDDAITFLYKQMALRIDESVQLIKIRDTLLPKLLSGELDVSNIDF